MRGLHYNVQTYVAIFGGKAYALSGLTLPHVDRLTVKVGDRDVAVRKRMETDVLLPGFFDADVSTRLVDLDERPDGCASR
jgi:hypothetical protein